MPTRRKTLNYDVALSFAGEDRAYVQQVAEILHSLDVKVFYDEYEKAGLWGANLFTHLDDIYRRQSRFCVIFVSKHYKRKLWTNHERESAQARALRSRTEYILPARFDNTPIPGLKPTSGYIDLKKVTPLELARLILEKLGKRDEVSELIEYLEENLGIGYTIKQEGTELRFICETENYDGLFPVRLMLEMHRAGQLERMFIYPAIVPQ